MVEKFNILKEANDLTIQMIDTLQEIPQIVVDDARQEFLDSIMLLMEKRGDLLKTIPFEETDKSNELYIEFQNNSNKLFSLFSVERENMKKHISRLAKNRLAHMQYFRNM